MVYEYGVLSLATMCRRFKSEVMNPLHRQAACQAESPSALQPFRKVLLLIGTDSGIGS